MEALITLVSGPTGALVLAVGALAWIAKIVVPMLEKYLNNQSDKLEKLVSALEKTVESHEVDRELFRQTLTKLSEQLSHIEADIVELRDAINSRKQ